MPFDPSTAVLDQDSATPKKTEFDPSTAVLDAPAPVSAPAPLSSPSELYDSPTLQGLPKDMRLEAANKVYVARRYPNISLDLIRSDWNSVKESLSGGFADGPPKDIPEEGFHAKLNEMAEDDKAYAALPPSSQKAVDPETWSNMIPKAKAWWNEVNKPLVELSEAPAMPNRPELGAYNPALVGAVWNSLKPVLEGIESPMGLATLGTASELGAAAKQYPAAKAALMGMEGVFTALMTKGTIEADIEAGKVFADPNSTFQDKVTAGGNVATQGFMAMLGALGMVETHAPKVLPELKGKSIQESADAIKIEALIAKEPEARAALQEAAATITEIHERHTLGDLIGKRVQYAGYEGTLIRDAEGNFVVMRDVRGAGQVRDIEVEGTGKDPLTGAEEMGLKSIEQDKTEPAQAKKVTAESVKTQADINEATRQAQFLQEPQTIKQPSMVKPAEETRPSKTVEASKSELRETSLKNATADMERKGLGLEEATPEEAHVMTESWDRARQALEKDSEAGARLTKELKEDPNIGLTDDESALLLRHKVGIENALNAAVDQANDAGISDAARAKASKQSKALSQELQDFMDAVRARGSEWGREGRWRQAMAKEDYSFAAQERLLRAQKGGAELSETETERLKATLKERDAKIKELEAHAESLAKKSAARKQQRQTKTWVENYLSDKASEARTRIKARMAEGRAASGIDPAEMADYAIVGADLIAKGTRKFAEWSASMVKEFGEGIKPHLQTIFDSSKKQHEDAKELSTKPRDSHEKVTTELADTKAKLAEVTKKEETGVKATVPEDAPEAKRKHLTEEQRLNQYKARTQARILELQQKIDSGDFGPREKLPPVALDEKGLRLKGELEAINQKFETARSEAKEEAKPRYQKIAEETAGIARASALSGYHTLLKLGAYSLGKFAETPAVEVTGALIERLPGMKGIAAKANLEAGSEAKGLAKFYVKAATEGRKDAWETLQEGKSSLKAEVGERGFNTRPIHWYDYFGISHMAEKSFLFRGDFELRLEKATAHAIANGIDVTDPMVQGALRKEAGEYANRSILQENNRFANWINAGHAILERVNPKTKEADASRVILSSLLKTFVTKGIVRTPANYIMQTLERGPAGLLTGVGRGIAAKVGGTANLSNAEANTIVRLIKVGFVGTGMFVWGAIDATKPEKDRIFGGYYQPGDKRKNGDVSFGKIRVDGKEIPHYVSHFPMTETAQMGSTFMRVMLSKLHKGDKENKGVLAGAMASVLALASSAPIASPITRTAQTIEQGHAEKVLWDEITGLIPQLVQNVALDTDTADRREQPKNLGQAVELAVPGLRQNVPQKRNAFSLSNEQTNRR